MEDCYQRATALLGKGQNDPAFLAFVEDLGEHPEVMAKTANGCSHIFRKTGLQMTFYAHSNCFASIFFHFCSAQVQAGTVQKYQGTLVHGIAFGDSRNDVEKKLAMKPSTKLVQGRTPDEPKDLWDEYELGLLKLRFLFPGSKDSLGALSVHYAPADI
ncbi:MAG TPA: hypothetical protein PKZ32_15260 [Candidatus Melainabacteria bacterium]|nr:hypothetical protein [Candidatus Melainabacteria bacterium]